MDVIRFCCYLFTVVQLADIAFGKSIRGKVRATVNKGKSKSEKAVYAHLYEDTKNDVNKAIENAILEASKKATDMVLEPKMQSHIVDQMADQMTSEMDAAGSGAAAASDTDKETAMANKEILTKKHHKGKQPKEATTLKAVDYEQSEDEPAGKAHRKTTAEKEEEENDGPVQNVEDEEGSSEEEAPKAPKMVAKPKKHIKKFKPKQSSEGQNVIDATESSAAEPARENIEEDEKEAEDDDEPEEEEAKDTEKNEVMPPITEAKADSPAPAKVEAKGDEEGQEDLKQLLDESITNLIKANSAVEVLLRATNERIREARRSCVKDKKCRFYCYRTLPVPPATQFVYSPMCARHNCCPPASYLTPQ